MYRLFVITILLLNLISNSEGAVKSFSPIVKSWTTSEYNAGRQNWSMGQDSDNIIYIGNNQGLLRFDGFSWDLYRLPQNSIVRSVFVDDKNRIYVGGYGEFGYFEQSYNGLEYIRLDNFIEDEHLDKDIWNITSAYNTVWFQTFSGIFYLYNNKIISIKTLPPLNLLRVNGKLYTQLLNSSFCEVDRSGVKEIISKDEIGTDAHIVGAMPYKKGLLLATDNNGLFTYDGKLHRFSTNIDGRLSKDNVNRAVMTTDSTYIIGTIRNGIYAIDLNGNLKWKINSHNSLNNNTVLGLLVGSDGNIWASLDNGISYIMNNAGIYRYAPEGMDIGMVYDFMPTNDKYLIATNQGLFQETGNGISQLPNTDGQVWYIQNIDNQILVGLNEQSVRIEGNNLMTLRTGGGGGLCAIRTDIGLESYVFEGTYYDIAIYKKDTYGKYVYSKSINDIPLSRQLEWDNRGYLWSSNFSRGIKQIKFNPSSDSEPKIREFNKLGEVKDSTFNIFKINGKIIFTNGKKFFAYDDIRDSIVEYRHMNESLAELHKIHQVCRANGNNYWFVSDRNASLVNCENNSFRIVKTIQFSMLGISNEELASIIYNTDNGYSYLCLNNGIVRINTKDFSQPVTRNSILSIHKITAFYNDGNIKELDFSDKVKVGSGSNRLDITLSYPIYNTLEENIEYQLVKGNKIWSVHNLKGQELKIRYDNLPAGKYRFTAKISEGGVNTDKIEFSIIIRRVWYASIFAIVLYILAAAFVLIFTYNFSLYHWRRLAEKRKELNIPVFDKETDAFYKSLKKSYPSLTPSDLRFCVMLRKNMPTKEIANELNITVRGAESARYRLRKKFNLSTDDNLTEFIMNFK